MVKQLKEGYDFSQFEKMMRDFDNWYTPEIIEKYTKSILPYFQTFLK